MHTLFTALLILFSLFLFFLFVSWRFRAECRLIVHEGSTDYSGSISVGIIQFGLGLIFGKDSRHIFVGSVNHPGWRLKIAIKKKPKRKERTPAGTFVRIWNKMRTLPARRLLKNVKRSIKWDVLSVKGVLGLDNPVQTGQVYGVLMGILHLVPGSVRRIELVPSFDGRKVDLDCRSAFRFRPIAFGWRVCTTFISRRH